MKTSILAILLCLCSNVVASEVICQKLEAPPSSMENLSAQDLYTYGLISSSESLGCHDVERAEQLFLKAANMRHPGSQLQLCRMMEHQENARSAVKWCYSASKLGNEKARERLDWLRTVVSPEVFSDGVRAGKRYLMGQGKNSPSLP